MHVWGLGVSIIKGKGACPHEVKEKSENFFACHHLVQSTSNSVLVSLWVAPRSHLQVKPSSKSHVEQFLRKGVGRVYFVAVTGSTRLLRGARGNPLVSAV